MFQWATKAVLVGGGVVLLAGVSAACGGSSDSGSGAEPTQASVKATATPPPETKVVVADNSLTPAEVTIKAGTRVVWEWSGSNPHSVLLSGRASETMTGSGKFEKVFDSPGTTFPYQCGVHGASMSGKIIVQ
ncbi:MAG: cupredoxin domain-containing protein [Tepidiformaceae bacterium]